MIQVTCPECQIRMSFPDNMAGEEVICQCRAMFTAPAPEHYKWTRPPNPDAPRQAPGESGDAFGSLLQPLQDMLTPLNKMLKGTVLNTETTVGRNWIGLFLLACLYVLVPLHWIRPTEFVGVNAEWGTAVSSAQQVWLGFVFDTAGFVVTVILVTGLIEMLRARPHATHKVRLACLLYLALFLCATGLGIVFHLQAMGSHKVSADYLAAIDGLASGFDMLYVWLIIVCLGVPAAIFIWSRRLEGIELTDCSTL